MTNVIDYSIQIENNPNQLAPAISIEQEKKTDEQRNFEVYPNPANDWVTIVLPESDELLVLNIFDLTGREVFTKTVNQALFIWDTALVGNGTYLITVSDQSKNIVFETQKLTIQH